MVRFRTVFSIIRRASADPVLDSAPTPGAERWRLSPRGRWVAIALATPGILAIVSAPFLMTSSSATRWTSAGNLLLTGGLVTVLSAHPVTLVRAAWSPWMWSAPADRERPRPPAGLGLAAALVLAGANLTGAVACTVLARHNPVATATALSFTAAGGLHLLLLRGRR